MEEHGTASVVQGWYMELVGAVVRQLPRDIDPTTAERWTKNQDSLKKNLRWALLPNNHTERVEVRTYPTVVDYGKSVEEMVELGQYNWADPLITSKHFPTKRTGKTELAIGLVCFGFLISTENAFTAFHLMHFRPVEIRELIAFDEKYFCLHRRFPIAAIGSVWQSSDGYRYIPYVSRGDTGRKLELEPGRERNEVWDGIFHFAVVRD